MILDLHSFPTRRPSDLAFTGTVALKPTFGRIPAYPPSPFGTLAHPGPMTRSVVDAATLLDIVAATDHRDWRSKEHTSELQSRGHIVCRLRLENNKRTNQ